MSRSVSYKTKQFFFVLIKLSIVAGAFYFIYHKLTKNEHLSFSDFNRILIENHAFSLKNISFLLFFTILNWFLEILKWQKLASIVAKISIIKSLEQSLGALTASLFTPNRIGEYGAKAIYFQYGMRKKIMLLNLLGNIAQMTITTIFGLLGFVAFYNYYNPTINPYKLFTAFGIMVFIFSFYRIFLKNKSIEIKGFPISKIVTFIKSISLKIKTQVLGLSILRYLIFSFQFWFLLMIFKIDLSYLEAMSIITSMYLLSSIIPSVFIFDIVIKSGVAVYLFSFAGVDQLIILSITTIMWLLNFVLPSVFGSYYVLNFNLKTFE